MVNGIGLNPINNDYVSKPIEEKTVSKDSLKKAIDKKLNSDIKFGNFFNGIHNRIANYFNKERTIALRKLEENLDKVSNVNDKNLPKSIRKKYESYKRGLTKDSSSKQSIEEINTKNSNTPKVAFGKDFAIAKPKTELNTTINLEDLWKNKKTPSIGKGSYGTVYASNDDQYVFKVIKNKEAYAEDLKGNQVLFEGIKEQDRNQAFYDQGVGFVTRFCGELKTEKGEKVLVFERAPGMEFADYLRKPELASENIQNKLYTHCALLGEAATAIAIAHEAGCVNRDIKPKNIMIGQQQEQDGQITAVAKLIDQGLVYDLKKPSDKKINICGTLHYFAPEMINKSVYDKGISPAADVFSMGVMLMEVLLPELDFVVNNFGIEGYNLYHSNNPKIVAEKFNRQNFAKKLEDSNYLTDLRSALESRVKALTPYSDKQLQFLGNLLKDCLAQEPEDRPSAAQVGELIQIFSASIGDAENLMPYEAAKKLAEEDRPKAIPIAIRNMIADPKNYHAGLKALEELVKADPSYIKTPSYGLAMLYKDKYSKRGKIRNFIKGKTSYKEWVEKNPAAASILKDRIYVEGGKPNEKQNIPVSQEIYDTINK